MPRYQITSRFVLRPLIRLSEFLPESEHPLPLAPPPSASAGSLLVLTSFPGESARRRDPNRRFFCLIYVHAARRSIRYLHR